MTDQTDPFYFFTSGMAVGVILGLLIAAALIQYNILKQENDGE